MRRPSNIEQRTLNIEEFPIRCGETSDVERRTSNVQPADLLTLAFDVRRLTFGVRRFLAAVLIGLALAGCNGKRPPPQKPYIPPQKTLSLSELIEALNARNAAVGSLYLASEGGGGFEANLRETRDQRARFVNGDIVAIYLAPDRMRLKGKKAGAGDVFDLGSDGARFWMHLPTEKQLVTGTFQGMHPENARQLPIRPDLVLEVIGIGTVSTDLLEPPAPMLRFNPDQDVYMLTWAEPTDGPPARWNVLKEVWYDRSTLLPKLVVLFDQHGDPVLRAYLSRHLPIGDTGAQIASRYELYFPESGSTMFLSFDGVAERNPGNRRFPNERSFNPPDRGAVPDPIDLDQPPPATEQAG